MSEGGADIQVIFATNADQAAASIDNAEKATAKATGTAEKFNVTQGRTLSATALSVKSLRGVGLAAGLMGAEFGGAIGKVAGLATAGASMGGPWGAAIGAGIGLASVAVKMLGSDSEETAKLVDKAREASEALAKSLEDANKAASAEGKALNKKFGPEIRQSIYNREDPFASKSQEYRDLRERGMSHEDAEGIAASRESYRERGGMFAARVTDRIGSSDKNYNSLQELNRLDRADSIVAEKQKAELIGGDYSKIIYNLDEMRNYTSAMLLELQRLNGGTNKSTVTVPNYVGKNTQAFSQ